MIKNINHQNFLTTPFVAAKNWRLFNIDPDDLVLLEPTGSDTVALEFTDYSTNDPFVNAECSIALEQQSNDLVNYQEGITGSGTFYPDSEATNRDGTFKRLVHSQIKSAFYNKYRNPTQIFGVDYIDFPLGNTFRDLSDFARVFTIPRNIFGERIIENTVQLSDNALDDNVEIVDDGYQNLVAKSNLFSKVQEVRTFGNIIMSGTSSYACFAVGTIQVSGVESSSVSIGFLFGTIDNVPIEEASSVAAVFYTGSLTLEIISSSMMDSGSAAVAFMSGTLTSNVLTSTGSKDTGSYSMTFYTGSLFDEVQVASISASKADSGSYSMIFYTGSLFNEVVVDGQKIESGSVTIAFLNGSLT